ncbi:MAG: hypothetical protein Q8Q09_02850 [Deltaproteobacteria bacterium]|nr:hypothetical protein [Deltaproteobacteria bacterium]
MDCLKRHTRTRIARMGLLAWALGAGPWGCSAPVSRASTVLPGHSATMDSLGFSRVGTTEDKTIARGATVSHPAPLRAGQCYRVVALATESTMDLELALYAPDGRRTSESLTSGTGSSLSYCASNDGVFRAAVSARAGQGTYIFGVWELDAERSGAARDRGTCVNPLPLVAGGDVIGSLTTARDNAAGRCVAGRNPDVVHVLDLERRQRVQLRATGTSTMALYVRRSCAGGGEGAEAFEGPTLACNVSREGEPALVDTTLDPGRYYVIVEGVGDGVRGAYTLASSEVESVDATDVCTRSTALEPGTLVVGNTSEASDVLHGTCASSRFPGPDQTYSLRVTEPSRVRVNVEAEGGWDTGVYLRSACTEASTEIACNDDYNDRGHSRISRILPAGNYSVTVDGFAQDARGVYSLGVERAPVDGATGPGDQCSNAFAIAPGESRAGDTFAARDDVQLRCGGRGPDQLFRFVLPRRALVRATLLSASLGTASAAISLGITRGCAARDELYCARDTHLDAVLAAGTYYLVVDSESPDVFGDYSVQLDAEDAEPTERACRDAQPLALGARASGTTAGQSDRLHASCGRGAASPDVVYSLQIERAGRLSVELRTPTFEGVVSVRSACERQGTERGCALRSDGNSARVNLAVEPGRYFVIVDGFDRGRSGTFELEARLEPTEGAPGAR